MTSMGIKSVDAIGIISGTCGDNDISLYGYLRFSFPNVMQPKVFILAIVT